MKCFLVTGGNGYIGSHMCQYLHQQGHKVVVLDNHSTSPLKPVHAFGEFHRGDVGDRETVSALLERYPFEAVFHFAAFSVVSESEEKPFRYFQNNTVQTATFVETLLQHDIKNLVFSSTSSTYGVNSEAETLSETTPLNPSNAYALSKKMVEDLLFYAARKYPLNVAILRYFNVAGSDPAGNIGENHEPESHLIPSLCLSALDRSGLKFKLFGDHHPTPDGTCIRDYIHVCDLVKAHFQAYEYIARACGPHVFNLGSGRGYSVREVMKVFEKVTGAPLEYEIHPPRLQDPPRLVCDIRKAHRELGFANEFGLEECVQHTLNYLKEMRTLPPQNRK